MFEIKDILRKILAKQTKSKYTSFLGGGVGGFD